MISVVLVAAGRSTRMAQLPLGETGARSSAPDKLFLPLGERPVLAHSLSRIQACAEVDEIVVVTRAERLKDVKALAEKCAATKVSHVVEGGAERQDSVWNGLQSLASDAQIVAVHDGARPFFPVALMPRLIEVARQYGSAVVSTKVTDTIKEVDIENVGAASAPRQNSQGTQPTAPVGAASRRDLLSVRVSRTVDRAKLRAVQTPQVFQLDMLKRAYAHVLEKRLHVTDEAAAVEALGLPVHLVENPDPNPKITTPLDLSYAELLLKI